MLLPSVLRSESHEPRLSFIHRSLPVLPISSADGSLAPMMQILDALVNPYFVVGDLSGDPRPSSKPIRFVASDDVGNDVRDGDRVSRWGWLMEWGEGCIRPAELEKVRPGCISRRSRSDS